MLAEFVEFVDVHCASSRYRRLPLSVPLAMMLPWAAPARPHCSQGPPRYAETA